MSQKKKTNNLDNKYIVREHSESYDNQLDTYKELSMDLKAIFDSSYDVIYVADNKGRTLRVSSACKRLWGKDADELVGKNVSDLEKEGIYSPSITRLVLERKEKVSTIQTTKTGKRLMVVGTPIKDNEGNVIRVVNASRDITEVSQLQAELAELRRLSEGYKQELMALREKKKAEHQIIYKSEEMKKAIDLAQRVASVDSTVLILGESGVGKEVVANFIHEMSARKEKPFIKINCGAIPESLLESELFGYDKGAFTGAKKEGKMGLFELANEGTLFLDEIAEMPFSLQVKLLRVLQENEIMRVGSTKTIKVNIRIIAATNRDLNKEIKNGRFREDLYYRLNVVPIHIRPLRERRQDILPLLMHFIEYYNQKYDKTKTLSPKALDSLQQYDWPGNVRELQNIVERLIVISDETEISTRYLSEMIDTPQTSHKQKVEVHDILPLKECLDLAEKQLLSLAKKRYQSTTSIANVLKVNQSTISRKLQKMNKETS
ncbi:sigma-54 interaction domain-containing protein [Pueribacillus theae]|uniref:sigma-54 interaction domain-containing protein n=1 Tax=Pueribacillus theae TaxID=2171751 RepID=UPI001F0C02D5|nr:sigma 54-interacting transcriptional regulator [Pueribacillus theae]